MATFIRFGDTVAISCKVFRGEKMKQKRKQNKKGKKNKRKSMNVSMRGYDSYDEPYKFSDLEFEEHYD